MKANEFVKKFGWEVAATDLRNHEKYSTRSILYVYEDLKRLVESWELIESVRVLGRTGYEEVKSHLNHCDPKWCHFHYKKWKQAILDVESCQ